MVAQFWIEALKAFRLTKLRGVPKRTMAAVFFRNLWLPSESLRADKKGCRQLYVVKEGGSDGLRYIPLELYSPQDRDKETRMGPIEA